MHVHRRSEYAKDILVLVSKATPQSYLGYLTERHYDFLIAGQDHVDYRAVLEQLNSRYGIKTIVTDTGGVLAGVLLDEGLVDEVHLLVAPEIVGKKAVHLFRNVKRNVKLTLARCETVDARHALLVYDIAK
jgi:2,5-diamino-6-(ribosylamino)-4(3H)-pyrimidinone 5'-phosphate reductase